MQVLVGKSYHEDRQRSLVIRSETDIQVFKIQAIEPWDSGPYFIPYSIIETKLNKDLILNWILILFRSRNGNKNWSFYDRITIFLPIFIMEIDQCHCCCEAEVHALIYLSDKWKKS